MTPRFSRYRTPVIRSGADSEEGCSIEKPRAPKLRPDSAFSGRFFGFGTLVSKTIIPPHSPYSSRTSMSGSIWDDSIYKISHRGGALCSAKLKKDFHQEIKPHLYKIYQDLSCNIDESYTWELCSFEGNTFENLMNGFHSLKILRESDKKEFLVFISFEQNHLSQPLILFSKNIDNPIASGTSSRISRANGNYLVISSNPYSRNVVKYPHTTKELVSLLRKFETFVVPVTFGMFKINGVSQIIRFVPDVGIDLHAFTQTEEFKNCDKLNLFSSFRLPLEELSLLHKSGMLHGDISLRNLCIKFEEQLSHIKFIDLENFHTKEKPNKFADTMIYEYIARLANLDDDNPDDAFVIGRLGEECRTINILAVILGPELLSKIIHKNHLNHLRILLDLFDGKEFLYRGSTLERFYLSDLIDWGFTTMSEINDKRTERIQIREILAKKCLSTLEALKTPKPSLSRDPGTINRELSLDSLDSED